MVKAFFTLPPLVNLGGNLIENLAPVIDNFGSI